MAIEEEEDQMNPSVPDLYLFALQLLVDSFELLVDILFILLVGNHSALDFRQDLTAPLLNVTFVSIAR